MGTGSTNLPDSTACGSRTVAEELPGGAKTSALVLAGMSSKTSWQEFTGWKVPRHWIADGVLYAPMITARLLSPPE